MSKLCALSGRPSAIAPRLRYPMSVMLVDRNAVVDIESTRSAAVLIENVILVREVGKEAPAPGKDDTNDVRAKREK
jgi:hypothetical protein